MAVSSVSAFPAIPAIGTGLAVARLSLDPLPGHPPSWSYDPYTAGGGCPNCGGKN